MFVRKKKNPSGVISVQIIDKTSGEYRVVKTMGSTSDLETVELLFRQGKKWIANRVHDEDLFEQTTAQAEEEELLENLLSNVENILINGTELILNRYCQNHNYINGTTTKKRKNHRENMFLTPAHKSIEKLFDDDFWENLI